MSCRRWMFVAALIVTSRVTVGAPATQPGLEQRVAQLLKQLDSDSNDDREAAADAATKLPAEALPLLLQAQRQPTVSAEVRSRLAGIVENLQQAESKQSKYQSYLNFFRGHLIGEYDKVGHQDPRWDDQARKYLEAAAQYFADEKDHRDNETDLAVLTAPLESAGCDDPMLRYQIARFGHKQLSPAEIDDVVNGLLQSKYSDFRKLGVLQWAAEVYPDNGQPRIDKVQNYYRQSIALWPDALKAEPNIPIDIALPWLTDLVERENKGDFPRQQIYDLLDGALAKQLPEESLIRLNVKGVFLVKFAWDARGGGWASSVTGNGWKLFSERLADAEKTLTRCYELYPDDPHAATTMLTVELGQGQGRPRMEEWFARAIKADPGNMAACRAKMWYLAPRWYGSLEDQLEFGRQCLASGRFESRVPLMVIDAHASIAPPAPLFSDVPNPYYARPDVWADVSTAYDGYLQQHPTAWRLRAWYAHYAYIGGKWKEAADLYQSLAAAPESYRNEDLSRVIQVELKRRLANPAANDPLPHVMAERRREADACAKLLADSYDAVGHKADEWNAAARTALAAAAKAWSDDPERNFSEVDTILESCDQAICAGCDDPLIRFIWTNTHDSNVSARGDAFKPTAIDDGVALAKSNYPARLRVMAVTWLASFEVWPNTPKDAQTRRKIHDHLDLALSALRQAAQESPAGLDRFDLDVGRLMSMYMALGDKSDSVYERVSKELDGALDPAAMRRLHACFLADAAYFNYPPSAANSAVQSGNQAARNKALADAAAELEAVWRDQPTELLVLQKMLAVARQQRRERAWMDFWFRQAMQADPTEYRNVKDYMSAIAWSLPQVGREQQDSLAEQCAANPDYRSQIPFEQVEYLVRIARKGKKQTDKPDGEVLGSDENWPKIAGVYEGYLSRFPLDSERRSEYASYACLTGRWNVAAEQFKLLGNHVKPKAFYTQQRLDACRDHIEELRGKGFLPASQPVER